jgi:Ca2+-binding RTX toxin-like protein
VLSSVSYALGSKLENLDLTGTADLNATSNARTNVLKGSVGGNELHDKEGNNLLDGGAGDGRLFGDTGRDVL